MGTYNVHAGHNFIVPGAKGVLDETSEDRKVKDRVISALRGAGHTVYDCTDNDGKTVNQNLANIVAKCNAHAVDLDISIHLNSGRNDYSGDARTGGVEVWNYSEKTKDVSDCICRNVAAVLNMTNRGTKYSKNLYVLRRTNAQALLVECCFVDDKDDANHWNPDKCGDAIASAILGKPVQGSKPATSKPTTPNTSPYRVGTNYTLQVDGLCVRTGAGIGYRAKTYGKLSANARKNAYSNGTLKKGTKVTCMATKVVGNDIWMQIPSGWIAAKYGGKMYVG